MRYVALLRGVNVGGSSRIDMRELKDVFEAAGMVSVATYINSGNVLFIADTQDQSHLAELLEDAIEGRFGIRVPVLVRNVDEIKSVVGALPPDWANDGTSKCDVMFLWPDVDEPGVLDNVDYDPRIDDVRYTPGAIIRRVARVNASRSRLTRIAGSPLYQRMTIRNCNTARKLLELLYG